MFMLCHNVKHRKAVHANGNARLPQLQADGRNYASTLHDTLLVEQSLQDRSYIVELSIAARFVVISWKTLLPFRNRSLRFCAV